MIGKTNCQKRNIEGRHSFCLSYPAGWREQLQRSNIGAELQISWCLTNEIPQPTIPVVRTDPRVLVLMPGCSLYTQWLMPVSDWVEDSGCWWRNVWLPVVLGTPVETVWRLTMQIPYQPTIPTSVMLVRFLGLRSWYQVGACAWEEAFLGLWASTP